MMKRVLSFGITVVSVLIFSGCVSSSMNYTPPQSFKASDVETTKIVNNTYNETWNKLIDSLSDNSFVINNMNKDSGFINISFSSDNPDSYVDCGHWQGHFKNLRVDEKYNFEGAESSRYIVSRGNVLVQVVSTTDLSGRINILLQKLEDKKQKIKVNVKYLLAGVGTKEILYPNRIENLNWSVGFGSKQKGRNKTGQTICQTNGTLEEQLLAYVN